MTSVSSAAQPGIHRMFCRLKPVELSIIGVLWDAGEGQTVRAVFEELYSRGPWSYNTVRGTMRRMEKAGVLRRRPAGRSKVYVPMLTREQVAAACVQEVIMGVLNGELADGMISILEALPLSSTDRRAIRTAL